MDAQAAYARGENSMYMLLIKGYAPRFFPSRVDALHALAETTDTAEVMEYQTGFHVACNGDCDVCRGEG